MAISDEVANIQIIVTGAEAAAIDFAKVGAAASEAAGSLQASATAMSGGFDRMLVAGKAASTQLSEVAVKSGEAATGVSGFGDAARSGETSLGSFTTGVSGADSALSTLGVSAQAAADKIASMGAGADSVTTLQGSFDSLSGTVDGLQTRIASLDEVLGSLGDVLSGLADAAASAGGGLNDVATEAEVARHATAELSAELEACAVEANSTGTQLEEAGVKAEIAGNQFEGMGRKAAGSGVGLSAAGTAAHTASGHTDTLGKSILDTGGKLGMFGIGVGAVTAGIAAFSIMSASKFNEAQTHVLAFTGTTKEQLQTVTTAIQQMSSQLGVSSTELMTGFYSIASSGLSAAMSMQVLRSSTNFAVGSQTDATIATRLLTGVTNAYHLRLKDIPKAQDDITQAVKIGTMEAKDYAPALSQIIPTAANLGVGLKELGAMFAVLTNNGVSAAEAGVYIGQGLQHLLAPTRSQIYAVEALGGSYKDLRVQHGDVIGTFTKLEGLLKGSLPTWQQIEERTGLTAKQSHIWAMQMSTTQGALAKLMGSSEGMKAFLSTMTNGGQDAAKAMHQMNTDAGVTNQTLKTELGSSSAQFKILSANIQLTAQQIGDVLMPEVLHATKDGILPFTKSLAENAKAYPDVTSGLINIGLAAGGVGLALKGGTMAWNTFSPAVQLASKGITILGGASVTAEGGLSLLGASTLVGVPIMIAATQAGKGYNAALQNTADSANRASLMETTMGSGRARVAVQTSMGAQNLADYHVALSDGVNVTKDAIAADEARAASILKVSDVLRTGLVASLVASNEETKKATTDIGTHYDAMRAHIDDDLIHTTSAAKKQWDLQQLDAIDAAQKIADAQVKKAQETRTKVIEQAAAEKDGVIQANLEKRTKVIATATEQENQAIESSRREAEGVIAQARAKHNGVVSEADRQRAGEIEAAGISSAGQIEQAKNTQLFLLSVARDQREKVVKEHVAMADDAIGSAKNLKEGVSKALSDLGVKAPTFIKEMSGTVKTEFSTMHTEVATASQHMADDAIKHATRMHNEVVKSVKDMHDTVSGHSEVPDMADESVKAMQHMADDSIAAAQHMSDAVTSIVTDMSATVQQKLTDLVAIAKLAGTDAGTAYAEGIKSQVSAVAAAAQALNGAAAGALNANVANLPGHVGGNGGGYLSGSNYGPYGGPSANYASSGDVSMLGSMGVSTSGGIMDTDFPAAGGTPYALPKGTPYKLIAQGFQAGSFGGYEVWRNLANGGTLTFLHGEQVSGDNPSPFATGATVPGGTTVGASGHAITTAYGNDPSFYHLCVITDTGERVWLSGPDMARFASRKGGGGTIIPQNSWVGGLGGPQGALIGASGGTTPPFNPFAGTIPGNGLGNITTLAVTSPKAVTFSDMGSAMSGFEGMKDFNAKIPEFLARIAELPPALAAKLHTELSTVAQQYDAAMTKYNSAVTKENEASAAKIASIHQTYADQAQNTLSHFSISQTAAHDKALAAESVQYAKERDSRSMEAEALKGHGTDLKKYLEEHGVNLKKHAESFSTMLSSHSSLVGRYLAAHPQLMEQALSKHSAAIDKISQALSISHEKAAALLDASLKNYSTREQEAIAKEKAAHDAHIAAYKATFAQAISAGKDALDTFLAGLKTAFDPSAILQAMQTAATNSLKTATDSLVLTFADPHAKTTQAIIGSYEPNLTAQQRKMNQIATGQGFDQPYGQSYLMAQAEKAMAEAAAHAQQKLDVLTSATGKAEVSIGRLTGSLATITKGYQDQIGIQTDRAFADALAGDTAGEVKHLNQILKLTAAEEKVTLQFDRMTSQLDLARGDLAGFSKSLDSAVTHLQDAIVKQLMAGGGYNSGDVGQIATIKEEQARAATVLAGVNMQVDLLTGNLSDLGGQLKTVGDYLQGYILADLIAGHGLNQAEFAQLTQVIAAQQQAQILTDGFTTILAAATVGLSAMSSAAGTLEKDMAEQWESAIVHGAGAQNAYTAAMVNSIKTQQDIAHAQALEAVTIGQLTGDATKLAGGLNSLFTESEGPLLYSINMIGRVGVSGAAAATSIDSAATSALNVATNLGTLDDVIKAATQILGDLQSAAGTEMLRTGSVDPGTISAYGLAQKELTKTTADQISGNLTLYQSTKDVTGYYAELGSEITVLGHNLNQIAATYGTSSSQYQAAAAQLHNVQNEYAGLGEMIAANGDITKVATDKQAQAAAAWSAFTSGTLTPGEAAIKTYTGTIATSATDIGDSFSKAATEAGQLGQQAVNSAGQLKQLVDAVSQIPAELAQSLNNLSIVNMAATTVNITTSGNLSAGNASMGGGGPGGGSHGPGGPVVGDLLATVSGAFASNGQNGIGGTPGTWAGAGAAVDAVLAALSAAMGGGSGGTGPIIPDALTTTTTPGGGGASGVPIIQPSTPGGGGTVAVTPGTTRGIVPPYYAPATGTTTTPTAATTPTASTASQQVMDQIAQYLADSNALLQSSLDMQQGVTGPTFAAFIAQFKGLSGPASNMLLAAQLGVQTPAKLSAAADYWVRQAQALAVANGTTTTTTLATGLASGLSAGLTPPVSAFSAAVQTFSATVAAATSASASIARGSAAPSGFNPGATNAQGRALYANVNGSWMATGAGSPATVQIPAIGSYQQVASGRSAMIGDIQWPLDQYGKPMLDAYKGMYGNLGGGTGAGNYVSSGGSYGGGIMGGSGSSRLPTITANNPFGINPAGTGISAAQSRLDAIYNVFGAWEQIQSNLQQANQPSALNMDAANFGLPAGAAGYDATFKNGLFVPGPSGLLGPGQQNWNAQYNNSKAGGIANPMNPTGPGYGSIWYEAPGVYSYVNTGQIPGGGPVPTNAQGFFQPPSSYTGTPYWSQAMSAGSWPSWWQGSIVGNGGGPFGGTPLWSNTGFGGPSAGMGSINGGGGGPGGTPGFPGVPGSPLVPGLGGVPAVAGPSGAPWALPQAGVGSPWWAQPGITPATTALLSQNDTGLSASAIQSQIAQIPATLMSWITGNGGSNSGLASFLSGNSGSANDTALGYLQALVHYAATASTNPPPVALDDATQALFADFLRKIYQVESASQSRQVGSVMTDFGAWYSGLYSSGAGMLVSGAI